ncbi:MFS transporter [Chloroflexota bacterium]
MDELKNNISTEKVRGKLFYGWVVALASASVILTASNFHYTFGVFIKPLIDRFGWSRTAISGCASIRGIMGGLVSPLAGAFSDKYGPRKFILAGILVAGLGYLLSSRINNLTQLYLFLGFFIGIGGGLLTAPIFALTTKWFGNKSALPLGIVTSGYGIGQILIPPIATFFILQYGWAMSFIVLGAAAWVLGSLSWSFIKTPSRDIATPPQKQLIREADDSKTNMVQATGNNIYTFSEAWHTSIFWILFLVFMLTAICYQMVVTHIVVAAIDEGLTLEIAAIILTVMGATNTLGRLLLGALATKFGNKIILLISLAIQAIALFFLAGASDLTTFYIISVFYGLAYGGTIPIIPTLTGSFFGTRSVGSIWGTINIGYPAGAAIGPLLGGYIFDITGSYFIAFSSLAIAMTIAFLLGLLLKPPKKNH